ncbi:MAG: hypothetical protein WCE91_02475, partial [Nitrososphaeraceae archaeon]
MSREIGNEISKSRIEMLTDDHHDQFYYIKRGNRVFVWITIFHLLFIAFIPFSTALLGEYTDQQISVVIYGINIAVAGFWAAVQWWYAAKDHRLIAPDLDPNFITMMSRRSVIGTIVYL